MTPETGSERHFRASFFSSLLIVLLTAAGTVIMFREKPEGILVARGLRNLKFFTVDSNLLLGLVFLADLIAAPDRRGGRISVIFDMLRYIAVTATTLTFTVVVVFFGPSVGYPPLFRNANLFFHLIVPVAGMIVFCLRCRGNVIPLKATFLTLIPSILYGAFYTTVLLIRGAHFPYTDWYGFAAGGLTGSVISAAAIFLLTWLLALLLRLAAGRTRKASQRAPKEVTRPDP